MKEFCLGAALGALTLGLPSPSPRAAGATITVTHELGAARPAEIIAVPFAQIAAIMPEARMYHLVVRDSKGRVLPSQITNYEHDHRGVSYDDLVFSYDFAAGEKRATFTLENLPTASPPLTPCVYARFVPERFDDMAWENDRIAHRMYGLALNSPARDCRTPARQRHRCVGQARHVSHRRSLVCQGSRPIPQGRRRRRPRPVQHRRLAWRRWHRRVGRREVVDLRQLRRTRRCWRTDRKRAVFKLSYAPWDAGSAGQVIETKRFTVDCGRNFDAVESVFDFAANESVVGIGISEHPQAAGFPAAVLTKDPDGRWMSFWEDNKDGGLGIAVILAKDATPAGFAHEDAPGGKGNANNLLLVKAIDGVPLRYLTGAGWTKSGQFEGRAAWETYVKDFAARAQKPLTITVSASK